MFPMPEGAAQHPVHESFGVPARWPANGAVLSHQTRSCSTSVEQAQRKFSRNCGDVQVTANKHEHRGRQRSEQPA